MVCLGDLPENPDAQAATIACLIAAGADPNVNDKSGVAPLHRAVRSRCAAAVKVLLESGADVDAANGRGSTLFLLQCRTRDAAGPALSGPRHNKQRYCACSKSMELGDRLLTTDISPLPSSLEVDIGLRNGPQSMLMFRPLESWRSIAMPS